MKKLLLLVFMMAAVQAIAQTDASKAQIAKKADALQSKIIAWRRDFHEHPELGIMRCAQLVLLPGICNH